MISSVARTAIDVAIRHKARLKARAFAANARMGIDVEIGSTAAIVNRTGTRDAIDIHDFASVHGVLDVERGGHIEIGRYSTVRFGSRLGAALSITIGQCVMISHDVFIYDNNNHPLNPRARHELLLSRFRADLNSWENSAKAPVVIEDDVWIGFNVIILKGVTIGRGAVIGAGAVVTKSIPPFAVAGGNPCRVVKTLENDLDS